MTKIQISSEQKVLQDKVTAFFINFKGPLLKLVKHFFLEGEIPTLKSMILGETITEDF